MNTNTTTASELERYLALLTGRESAGGLLEIRYRDPRSPTRMRQQFHDTTDTRRLARHILSLAEQSDVYIGVAPRRIPNGGRHAIHSGWVLWADIDKPASQPLVAAFPVAPGVIINSGTPGHQHLYWPLTEPLAPAELERANATLARALDADSGAVLGAATILRPPHTRNHKHTPASTVTLERLEPRRRSATEILDSLPAVQPPAPPPAAGRRNARRDPLQRIEPARYVELLTEQVVPRDRKISCPFHELSGRRAVDGGFWPAPSFADASLTDRWGDLLRLVPPRVYFERLTGLRVGRSGKLRCLFHDDRSPSLHVYEEPERGWYCFGCGRGGSIYDLAASLLGRGTRGQDFVQLRRWLEELMFPLIASDGGGGSAGGWVRGAGTSRGLDAGLDVAGGDHARDHAEQPSQGAFGEVALESGAEVAACESAGAEERAERPVGSDRAAVGGLEHLVGDDPTDRGQERRRECRGGDLIGGVAQREQDRRED